MSSFTKGKWTEYTDENGDVWVLAGNVKPEEMHAYLIGNMEDTCGECHANAQLMVNAPKYYAALKRIARYAALCQTCPTGAGYRRIAQLAQAALKLQGDNSE